MAAFLSNAFNDPSSPWYYVIGVLFLLLIFGALAVYIILTNKKKKNENGEVNKDETSPDTVPNENETTEPEENKEPEQSDENK